MKSVTQEELVRLAHQFYPQGFPPEQDDPQQPVPAHQQTPEHQRFNAAWERALQWEEWGAFMERLAAAFPEYEVGGGTQPFVSACLRCQLYQAVPQAEGDQRMTRVAVAVSVLAPLYIIYITTQSGSLQRKTVTRPQLGFEPSGELKPTFEALAALVEETLKCRPFPLALAQVPLLGVRVGQLNALSSEPPPMLLEALFSEDLANLP